MAMRIAGIVLVVLLVVVLVWRPPPMASCGGYFVNYVFTWAVSFSLKDAASGRWDVLQPSYRHVGLILAYRYLSGVKLTAEELRVLAPGPRILTNEEFLDSWPPGVNTWLQARKKVPSAPPGCARGLGTGGAAGGRQGGPVTRQDQRGTGARPAAAPSYLAREAIAYARTHPNDPRVPESLHLAVRATRYGCTDAATGKFSKQAFDLLHQRYPKSAWAEKTPYWYR